MPVPRWQVRAVATPERLSGAAAPLLCVRVLEGLIAWLFFNEYFTVAAVRGFLLVQGAFVAYLLLNLLVTLRYRRGYVSGPLVLFDIVVNVLSLSIPIAASGGPSSPLLLLLPLQALLYVLVFGEVAGLISLAIGGSMLLAVELADRAVLISAIPLSALRHGSFDHVVAFALVEMTIGAPLAAAWISRAHRSAAPPPRLRLSDKDASPAVVANALLTVSEAVNSLTRLDEILATVVQVAPRSIEMDHCGIALWTPESGTYVRTVSSDAHADGPGAGMAVGQHIDPEQVPDFEWVRRLGHCAVVPVAESLQVAPVDVPAVLIAPLASGPHFFGVMEFARRNPSRGFTQRDMTIADGIARQTAVAIERARLVEESRRLVRAVESTEEAVVMTDARRRIIFANGALIRMLGYQKEEVIGRDVLEIDWVLPEPLEQFQETLMRRSWRGETVVRRKDGTAIPIILNASLIRDSNGAVRGAVGILDDISEEKHFQEQMQRADRLAAVGETAAGLAHEINNALAAILGQTDTDEVRGEAELREALARVDAEARRIAEIVRGVLGFARPRAPQPVPLDLATLAAKTLELVQHDLSRYAVRLDTAFAEGLPEALGDPQQLQQVLLNLFTNAIQAMTGGTDNWLRVEARAEGHHVALRVTDHGPGIPADVLPRIFDPFFSTKVEGSGLGLSVSFAIAHAHGGDLRVESELGRGTTFTLLLPTAAPAGAKLERVLLVDDDPDVAEALTAMLVKEGLQVSRAATGAEGVARLASENWDAVFLDVRLPDVPGPEIYRGLERTRPDLAQRVVFVTGGVWRSESRLRQELPPQPILAKPCTQDEVRAVLRQLRAQRLQAA